MKHSFTIFLILIVHTSYAQNILISNIENPKEACIKINPKKPNQIIAGSVMNGFHISNDTGRTWTSTQLTSQYNVWGDPCVDFDTTGKIYYFHLSNPKKSKGYYIDRLVLQTSEDEGKTFTDGIGIGLNIPKQQDKEWCFVNPNNNHIYLSWTQFDKYGSKRFWHRSNILFSKSTDQGLSWSKPKRVNRRSGDCIDSDKTVEGAMTTLGPNGELYMCWAGKKGIYFDKSLDEGVTWQKKDEIIDFQAGGWDINIPGIDRANGFPIIDCDRGGGKHNGNVYIFHVNQLFDFSFISLNKSKDNGESWDVRQNITPPVYNNDSGDLNDLSNLELQARHEFGMWFTIDQSTGYLYILSYRQNNPKTKKTDVYLSYSKDGGETFKEIKISESSFTPDKTKFFGDYNGISAVNGIIRPVWTGYDKGQFSIWTHLISEKDLP